MYMMTLLSKSNNIYSASNENPKLISLTRTLQLIVNLGDDQFSNVDGSAEKIDLDTVDTLVDSVSKEQNDLQPASLNSVNDEGVLGNDTNDIVISAAEDSSTSSIHLESIINDNSNQDIDPTAAIREEDPLNPPDADLLNNDANAEETVDLPSQASITTEVKNIAESTALIGEESTNSENQELSVGESATDFPTLGPITGTDTSELLMTTAFPTVFPVETNYPSITLTSNPTISPTFGKLPTESCMKGFFRCQISGHPWTSGGLFLIILLYCRYRVYRASNDVIERGQYRAVAAHYTANAFDDTFDDDLSYEELDVDGHYDNEENHLGSNGSKKKRGVIEMNALDLDKDDNGGLTLQEMNG